MRTRFDQFAKQMARAAFGPGGTVHTNEEVSPDTGAIDIWFTPREEGVDSALSELGMLGRIGRVPCTLEPFHQSPDGGDVMDCVCKHHHFRKRLARGDPGARLPIQWIISSGRPTGALAGLRFEPCVEWGAGVHEGPPLTFTRIIVVADLPEGRDTLLLRLMGAGRVLVKAIAELRALAEPAPERMLALPILVRLRLEIPADPSRRTPDEEEFVMSTEDIVETFRRQAHDQGRSEGLREGHREGLREGHREGLREGHREGFCEAVIAVYTTRFGAPPADVVAVISAADDRGDLQRWLELAATGQAHELVDAVRAHAARHTLP